MNIKDEFLREVFENYFQKSLGELLPSVLKESIGKFVITQEFPALGNRLLCLRDVSQILPDRRLGVTNVCALCRLEAQPIFFSGPCIVPTVSIQAAELRRSRWIIGIFRVTEDLTYLSLSDTTIARLLELFVNLLVFLIVGALQGVDVDSTAAAL